MRLGSDSVTNIYPGPDQRGLSLYLLSKFLSTSCSTHVGRPIPAYTVTFVLIVIIIYFKAL